MRKKQFPYGTQQFGPAIQSLSQSLDGSVQWIKVSIQKLARGEGDPRVHLHTIAQKAETLLKYNMKTKYNKTAELLCPDGWELLGSLIAQDQDPKLKLEALAVLSGYSKSKHCPLNSFCKADFLALFMTFLMPKDSWHQESDDSSQESADSFARMVKGHQCVIQLFTSMVKKQVSVRKYLLDHEILSTFGVQTKYHSEFLVACLKRGPICLGDIMEALHWAFQGDHDSVVPLFEFFSKEKGIVAVWECDPLYDAICSRMTIGEKPEILISCLNFLEKARRVLGEEDFAVRFPFESYMGLVISILEGYISHPVIFDLVIGILEANDEIMKELGFDATGLCDMLIANLSALPYNNVISALGFLMRYHDSVTNFSVPMVVKVIEVIGDTKIQRLCLDYLCHLLDSATEEQREIVLLHLQNVVEILDMIEQEGDENAEAASCLLERMTE